MTVIAPNSPEIHQVLCKALESIPLHKKPRGKQWLVHFQHTFKFDNDHLLDLDLADIETIIDGEWVKLRDIVSRVEAAILNYQYELKALS